VGGGPEIRIEEECLSSVDVDPSRKKTSKHQRRRRDRVLEERNTQLVATRGGEKMIGEHFSERHYLAIGEYERGLSCRGRCDIKASL